MKSIRMLVSVLSLTAITTLFTGCLPPGFQKGRLEGELRLSPAYSLGAGFGLPDEVTSSDSHIKVEVEARICSLDTDFNDTFLDSTQYNANGEVEIKDETLGVKLHGHVLWGGIYTDQSLNPASINPSLSPALINAISSIQSQIQAKVAAAPKNGKKGSDVASLTLLYGFLGSEDEEHHQHRQDTILGIDPFVTLIVNNPTGLTGTPIGDLPPGTALVLFLTEGDDGVYLGIGLSEKGKIRVSLDKKKN